MSATVRMIEEALQGPAIVAKQFQANEEIWEDLCRRLKKIEIPYVLTVARGSSDHAATFAKYLLETQLGLTTASAAPSVVTLYHSRQKLKNCLVLALSQSGESPDICEVFAAARQQGAITVALVNRESSQLAKIAEYVLPLWAGEEQSVAATKSYIAMLAALLQGVAIAAENAHLRECLRRLPDLLQASCQMDWSIGAKILRDQQDLLIIGRGFGFPVALEAALKCKETAALHAEAFSSAEVQHGPMALVRAHYPVLLFCQDDVTFSANTTLVQKLHRLGSRTLVILPKNLESADLAGMATILPLPASVHGLMDPIMAIQAFYLMAAELSALRGYNPDQPANLQKITKTI
jgi:glutamine---fructose-6-phosphate transaminase (isomerizing)